MASSEIPWQQVLIWYSAIGAATYIALIVVIPLIDTKSPEAEIQRLLGDFRRKQDQRNNPGWQWHFKNGRAYIAAQVLAALVVVIAWPLAIGLKARNWLSQRAQAGIHMRNIEYIAKSIGLSFADGEGVSPVEQIFLLDKSRDDIWMCEAPGFFDLVIQAHEIHNSSKPNDIFFEPAEFLSLPPDELKLYSSAHKLSEQDEARVIRWAKWHRSAEADALEAFFRRLWQQQENSNPEYVRSKAYELRPFPRAVVDLALIKSHRRCCVCHDFNAPRVAVCPMVGAPDVGAKTIEQAICLCGKCSEIWSFHMQDALEPKYFKLKAKRDRWWEHCQRHPEEQYGLFLDVGFRTILRTTDVHRYRLVATYTNTTKEVQDGWDLKISIPGFLPLRFENYDRSEKRILGTYVGDPAHAQLAFASSVRIHPGETVEIVPLEGRYIEYEVSDEIYGHLIDRGYSVLWEFTIPNAPKMEGVENLFNLQDWHQRKVAA